MRRFLLLMSIALVFLSAGLAEKKPRAKSKPAPVEHNSTFTGCIDQKGENYVLTGDVELRTIAVLHGDGFDDDNFAREMGHKVKIEGTLTGDADPKTIRVKRVTKISDSCSPD